MTLTQIWYHIKVLIVEIIICQSLVKLKKPTLAAFSPKIRILAQFRPDQAILQVIPHKKKSWGKTNKKVWKPLPFFETSEGDQGI